MLFRSDEMVVHRLNWQLGPAAGKISVKIRSRHSRANAEILSFDSGEVRVKFGVPQKAVTPGQAAAFYDDAGRVIGGGWILRAFV